MDAGGLIARSAVGGLLGAVGGGPAVAAAAVGFVPIGMGPGVRGGQLAVSAPLRVVVSVGRRRTPTRSARFLVSAGAVGDLGGDGGAKGAASGRRRRVKVNAAETPGDPKRASIIVRTLQTLSKALDYLAKSVWRSALGLMLFTACAVLGYLGAKGNEKAKFAIDVLDKANKSYKPALECATLVVKFAVTFIKRYS